MNKKSISITILLSLCIITSIFTMHKDQNQFFYNPTINNMIEKVSDNQNDYPNSHDEYFDEEGEEDLEEASLTTSVIHEPTMLQRVLGSLNLASTNEQKLYAYLNQRLSDNDKNKPYLFELIDNVVDQYIRKNDIMALNELLEKCESQTITISESSLTKIYTYLDARCATDKQKMINEITKQTKQDETNLKEQVNTIESMIEQHEQIIKKERESINALIQQQETIEKEAKEQRNKKIITMFEDQKAPLQQMKLIKHYIVTKLKKNAHFTKNADDAVTEYTDQHLINQFMQDEHVGMKITLVLENK